MGWGGDVNVRLKLNTPFIDATLSMGWGGVGWGGVGWEKQHRSTCTMISETGKAKKGPDFVWKGCQTQENDLLFLKIFTLRRLRNTERVVIF